MRIELYKEMPVAPSGKSEDNFMPYLDTFLLEGASTPLGAVLILPGGGYTHRAIHEGDPVAKTFNKFGFHAFTLQYRVEPYCYPAAQMDAIRAIKIIRANAAKWRVDPDKIAIGGFSAGGHLAACAGLLHDKINPVNGDEADAVSGRPDAMILCYGVLSVTKTYTERNINCYEGTPYRDENGKDINPCELVTPDTPPAYVWHSADDGSVPSACSFKFAEAMNQAGVSCNLHVFPHAPHGKGLAISHNDICKWPEEAAQFLKLWCGFPG